MLPHWLSWALVTLGVAFLLLGLSAGLLVYLVGLLAGRAGPGPARFQGFHPAVGLLGQPPDLGHQGHRLLVRKHLALRVFRVHGIRIIANAPGATPGPAARVDTFSAPC